MGNNPSRTTAAHAQQSTNSSASASPPTAPARAPTSGRRAGYRRNSLQHPTSARYSSPSTQDSSAPQTRTDYRYAPPPPQPIRRESIAEAPIPEYLHNTYSPHTYSSPFVPRTREELLADAATLRQFPSPPTPTRPMTTVGFSEINYNTQEEPTFRGPSTPTATSQPRLPPGRGSVESTLSLNEVEVVDPTDTRAIPTLVEWPYSGNKVYLTGTFCGWSKRYRLARQPGSSVMSAIIPITPGTHHIKFIVDGEMRTSQAIPTAVDDTGILVNYLEISADDMPPLDRHPSPDSTDIAPPAKIGEKHYTSEIPAYLHFQDDDSDEGDGRMRGPPPPSLPMMLQKVILNTSNQMKDDASVLTIPNHAVLNHLATSSIKNQILAVSATTRYKKKYVTTLLYKAATS